MFKSIKKLITFGNGKSVWFPIYQSSFEKVLEKFAAHPEWHIKGLYCIE